MFIVRKVLWSQNKSRKIYNEKVKGLKQEIFNLKNEISDLEDNKKSINKQITKLNKYKTDIVDEIDKNKKIDKNCYNCY